MHRAVVILGSNIDKEQNLPAAVEMLAGLVGVINVSSVYETAPEGLLEQPHFFNAAVLLQTDLTPAQLKDGPLSEIERRLGRRRSADKNAPRTIDLDIVLFDDEVTTYTPADGRVRHLPDADLLRFAHCALPVADLLPNTLHPQTGESLRSIAARLLSAATIERGDAIRPRLDIDLRRSLPGMRAME